MRAPKHLTSCRHDRHVEKGQVLTANRLRDGEVVFLTRSGEWSETIEMPSLPLEPRLAKRARSARQGG